MVQNHFLGVKCPEHVPDMSQTWPNAYKSLQYNKMSRILGHFLQMCPLHALG